MKHVINYEPKRRIEACSSYMKIETDFFTYDAKTTTRPRTKEENTKRMQMLLDLYNRCTEEEAIALWGVRRLTFEMALQYAMKAVRIAADRRLSKFRACTREIQHLRKVASEPMDAILKELDNDPELWRESYRYIEEIAQGHFNTLYWQMNQWAKDSGYSDESADFDVVVNMLTAIFFCGIHIEWTQSTRAKLEARDPHFEAYDITPMDIVLVLAIHLQNGLPLGISSGSKTVTANLETMRRAFINDLTKTYLID